MEKKILNLDQESKIEVRAFELTDLKGGGVTTFRTPTLDGKKRVSSKPPVNTEIPRKDRRFQVDPALRSMLAVTEDSEDEIGLRVEERVTELRRAAEEEARDRGYEAGFKRGKEEAKSSYEVQGSERIAKLDELISAIEGMKEKVYHANERFLVELVFRIASSLLQRELVIDPEYLARVVRTIVEKVGVKEQLKLIASSSKMEVLYALLPELEKKHASLKNITVESSTKLGDSDVVVETDWNRIDATFNSQLGSLHEVVLAVLDEKQNGESVDSASKTESA